MGFAALNPYYALLKYMLWLTENTIHPMVLLGWGLSMRVRYAAFFAFASLLAGCADPHYIHDPQTSLYFTKAQLPGVLKSLRCELATYIAANNQHHILNEYVFNLKNEHVAANSDWPFFPLDPALYGGLSLDLKIQDTLGTQSGTTFDWKRTAADNIHSHAWHFGPSLGEQNTYDMSLSFLVHQDIYGLDESEKENPGEDVLNTDPNAPYLCYKSIPTRTRLPVGNLSLKNAEYAEQDLDAIAADRGGTPQFQRIRVDGNLPLAAWLLQVGTTVTSTSLVQTEGQRNEWMVPGQQIYTFTMQTSAGIDIKNTLTTSLWTAVGGELSGSLQHTGTLTIYLNGADAATTAGTKSGSTARSEKKQISPKPPVTVTVLNYCDLPIIGGKVDSKSLPACQWPPKPPVVRRPLKAGHGFARKLPAVQPSFRNFGSHGILLYPLPLSPLGVPQ